MKKNNSEKYNRETNKIIRKALIVYKNGTKELYEAIQIYNNLIIFGRILEGDIFLMCGGIPKDNVRRVVGSFEKKRIEVNC
jgi:hypothetical protein